MTSSLERYRPLVDDWPSFEESILRPLPTCIWTNSLRVDWEETKDQLRAEGVDLEPVVWSREAWKVTGPLCLSTSVAFRAGAFHLQEEASLLPLSLMGLRPGHRVLELCAAPGGKTALIAIRLGGRGTVVANDVSGGRQSVTRTTLDRLGLCNVTLTVEDGRDSRWPSSAFDRVLVDAPCSAEGTVRKYPRAAARTSPASRRRLVEMQKGLLLNAFRICRAGGRLVYSTCTFAPEENEGVVAEVLDILGDAARILPVPVAGLPSRPGLTSWDGQRFPAHMAFAHRLWPHDGDTGGFFAVAIEKVGGAQDGATAVPESSSFAATDPVIEPFLEPLRVRFGLDSERLGAYRYRRSGKRFLYAFPADHRPAVPFEPHSSGLAVVRVNGRIPKPTTRAAVAFGHAVTRNRVLLRREEALRFIAGHPARPDPSGAAGITSPGWVLVACGRLSIGIGVAVPEAGGWSITSRYPKTFGGVLSSVADRRTS